MEWALSPAKSFSCVRGSVDEQFFSQCAREYALSLASMVMENYGPACAPEPALLSTMLEHPLASGHVPLWCPELGHCLLALRSHKLPAAQRGLTQLVVNLLCAGVPGTWEVESAEPLRFRWDRFLLPKALHLRIDSDGKEARVDIRGPESRQAVRFYAAGNGRRGWEGADAEALPYLELGHNRALLLSAVHHKGLDLPDPVFPGVDAVTEAHKRLLSDPLDLVREHFPSWSSWFDRVIRTITITQSPPEGTHSGTVDGYYGYIWIGDSGDALKVAESLIHEASHQYYFLLSRLVPLTNDDGRRFYSPFVKRERPPDKLLLAYHAFANVEIFYAECLRLGIEPAQCERALAQLGGELGHVQRVLSDEIDMTPAGRSLFDALHACRSSHGALN
ncbi:MAG: HEXXH motif-containing putative peptide modification protein [Pyrinomonadaceae bacterium]